MPSVKLIKHLEYDAGDLLSLVANVEDYPNFINLISALRIKNRSNLNNFEAEAVVSYKLLRECFKSRVMIDPQKRSIFVEKSGDGGALKSLMNKWVFYKLSNGSTAVLFEVDVSLKAFPLNLLVQSRINRYSEIIMEAFENRASELFKKVNKCGVDFIKEIEVLSI
mgnify:FL=1